MKGEQGETKGNQQGERQSKGNAPCIVVHCDCARVYIECLRRLNDTSLCIYIIIIIGVNVVDNLNSV